MYIELMKLRTVRIRGMAPNFILRDIRRRHGQSLRICHSKRCPDAFVSHHRPHEPFLILSQLADATFVGKFRTLGFPDERPLRSFMKNDVMIADWRLDLAKSNSRQTFHRYRLPRL
ncbi:hypothetical protein GCM10027456_77190 [Kineosporia babensis]